MAKIHTWTTYYRTGGTANFKWQTAMRWSNKAQAEQQAEEIRRGGRSAHVMRTDRLQSVGLPETFE